MSIGMMTRPVGTVRAVGTVCTVRPIVRSIGIMCPVERICAIKTVFAVDAVGSTGGMCCIDAVASAIGAVMTVGSVAAVRRIIVVSVVGLDQRPVVPAALDADGVENHAKVLSFDLPKLISHALKDSAAVADGAYDRHHAINSRSQPDGF